MRSGLALLIFLSSIGPCWSQDGFIEDGPALAYWQVGHRKNVVIVLHGGPAVQHQYLRPEFDALRRVARVIYYDQRGCGKSAKAASYSWQEHVNDLRRLIKTISKANKVFLAGSSWGSALALIYSYKHPEDIKGLILTGTYPWEGKAMSPYAYSIEKRRLLVVAKEAIIKMKLYEHKMVSEKDKDGQSIQKLISISKEAEVLTGEAQAEPRISFATAPVIDSLARVNIPVLIFRGTRQCQITDWSEHYMRVLPQARLCTIVDACHDPWFSNPKQFFTVSKSFIKKFRKQ